MQRLLANFSFVVVTACAPEAAQEPMFERYDACEQGWSCAATCELPVDALMELGCAPGDFASTPPDCRMEDNCANAKSECFTQCEADYLDTQAQIDCKIECDDTFGNEGTCKQEFELWQESRDQVLRSLREDCLIPCETQGMRHPTRSMCDLQPELCDPVAFATHLGVAKSQACLFSEVSTTVPSEDPSEDPCAWTCSDLFASGPSVTW